MICPLHPARSAALTLRNDAIQFLLQLLFLISQVVDFGSVCLSHIALADRV
jgi:hypothetical protein